MARSRQRTNSGFSIVTEDDPFAYLSRRREQTAHAIRRTLGGLEEATVASADPVQWARNFPRSTALASFLAGLTAARATIPRRKSPSATQACSVNSTWGPANISENVPNDAPTNGRAADSVGARFWAAAKSAGWGAAYGLGRIVLSQALGSLLAGHAQSVDRVTPSPAENGRMDDERQPRGTEFQPDL
jgi:hypothetical protein